ncbi:ribokinase [Actinomarinicola tropica]|uniref:Ribokinase n=1 Tax=Actinomarinicola tropica TaxID=2789776 RepID=A0A5Q2RJZ8_9ACTN|nr:ribokinase [Actinomarinicola tropica]QGG94891.1 ribokinase [Actinomarinicola tropica]
MAVRIACFGSMNHDLTLWVPHPPAPDETVRAHRVAEFIGGKGANQAIAARRLGAEVAMIGRVGTDSSGAEIVEQLRAEGIDTTHVVPTTGPTGRAVPIVSDDGEVSIIIVAGANGAVGPSDAEDAAEVIAAADVLLLQGEVAAPASGRAAAIAADAGTLVVFNAAPVPDRSDLVLQHDPIVVVNSHEALELRLDSSDRVIVTLGSAGVQVGEVRVGAFSADTIDPTGAGDSFVGAFALALAEGADAVEAARVGAAAGAHTVSVAGASTSMPTRAQVDAILDTGH